MPAYALVFMLFMMASVGLPGTAGFVGEFLTIMGAFRANVWVALLAATGMVLGAGYMLWLYRRVIFGALTKPDLKSILDLSPREIAIFAPLVVLTLWMGIYPSAFIGMFEESVKQLIENHQTALLAPAAPVALAGLGQ
jgi:NADH-quinone oxidoreductase subunit M